MPGADSTFPVEESRSANGQADDPSGSSPADGGDTGPARSDLQLLSGGIGGCCLGLVCEEISREECTQRHGRFLGVGRECAIEYCLAFLAEIDTDNDGLTDLEEIETGLDPDDPTDGPDVDGDGVLNDDDPDIDGDGLPNHSDPDMDGDGLLNTVDPDLDGDGAPNIIDVECGDGFCTDAKENPCNCSKDCGLDVCGDVCCSGKETRCSCPGDCGTCTDECCGDDCADKQTDEKHCGKCDSACKADEECCAGRCIDVRTDEANCGKCGRVCPADDGECTEAVCSAGVCTSRNSPAGTACGDKTKNDCTDPDTCDGAGECLKNDQPDGTECDDLYCTINQVCDSGVCSGGETRTCDDRLPCTTDTCNKVEDKCVFEVKRGNCRILGKCYADGDVNPDNECQYCEAPDRPSEDWSPCSRDTPCTSDENECTDDFCDGMGYCEHRHVEDGTPCCEDRECCSGECVDLQSDNDHCGDCKTSCEEGETCKEGECEEAP